MKFINCICLKAFFCSVISFCAFGSQKTFVINPALKAKPACANAEGLAASHQQSASGQAATKFTLDFAVASGILADVTLSIAAGEPVTQAILDKAKTHYSTAAQTESKARKEIYTHLLKEFSKKRAAQDKHQTESRTAAGLAQPNDAKDQKKAAEEVAHSQKAVGAQASASALAQGDETESEDDIKSDFDSEQFLGEYQREDLKQKIEAGTFNLDERIDEDGEHTIMMEAAIHNDVEIAELAIQKGFKDFHAQNKNGDNALTLAALYGSIGMMELLAQYIAIDIRDRDGNTALNTAVAGDQLEMVGYLLGTPLKKNINTENNSGMTPLINSVLTNNPLITRLLLMHGADASHKPSKCPDQTALACARLTLTDEFIKGRIEFGQTEDEIHSNNAEIIQMIVNADKIAYAQLLSELDKEAAKKKKKAAKKLKQKNKSAKVSAEVYRAFLTTPKYLAANNQVYKSIANQLKGNPQLATLDQALYERALKVTEQLDKDMAELSRLLAQQANGK